MRLKYREEVKEREGEKRTWWMEIGDMGWTMNPVFSATTVNTNSLGAHCSPSCFFVICFWWWMAQFTVNGYQPGVFLFLLFIYLFTFYYTLLDGIWYGIRGIHIILKGGVLSPKYAFGCRLFCWKLKIKNNKKIIFGYCSLLFTTVQHCLLA